MPGTPGVFKIVVFMEFSSPPSDLADRDRTSMHLFLLTFSLPLRHPGLEWKDSFSFAEVGGFPVQPVRACKELSCLNGLSCLFSLHSVIDSHLI